MARSLMAVQVKDEVKGTNRHYFVDCTVAEDGGAKVWSLCIAFSSAFFVRGVFLLRRVALASHVPQQLNGQRCVTNVAFDGMPLYDA